MSQKQYTVNLTGPEIFHIECLLRDNEREGWYFPPKEEYWNRHQRIVLKLKCSKTGGNKREE